MEHDISQPISLTPQPVHKKYKGVIIAAIVAVVAILVVVLLGAHKKNLSPIEELQALENISEPTTQTLDQRAATLQSLRSTPPPAKKAEDPKPKQ